MKVSRFISPYSATGKTNIGFTKDKAGVYIITKNGRIVYIGYSATNLYSTILRHFQEWNDKRATRVTYYDQMQRNDFKVRTIIATADRAAKLEKALILKFKPKDNTDKLKGYILNRYEEKALEDYEYTPVATMKQLEDAPF